MSRKKRWPILCLLSMVVFVTKYDRQFSTRRQKDDEAGLFIPSFLLLLWQLFWLAWPG